MHRFYILLIAILFISFDTFAVEQPHRGSRPSVIHGTVTDKDGNIIPFASVYIQHSPVGTTTHEDGKFMLRVPAGKFTFCVQMLGYTTYEEQVEIKASERREIYVVLEEANYEMEAVEVIAQSTVQQINKTAYNVVAIDAKALHNTSLAISHALDRVSGVKIKEVGGVGSETQISLNGFSGRHVRIYMDGIPLEGSGSALQINNIPISLADHIEVYKGVVPIELGADALGGAINIVTKNTSNTYIDASYGYGSFNTHKSNVSLGHTTKKGLTVQLNAYQNYSDNNYKVKTQLLDLETNTYSVEEYWFRRFHDRYRNEAVMAKIGVRDRKWATRLLFEMTYSQEKADIQNANLMKIVYGGRERSAKSYIPALTYEKRNLFTENLNLTVTAKYNHVLSESIDTLARQYNWAGDYREKTSKGELGYSLREYNNNTTYVTGNLNYKLSDRHHFSLNHVFTTYSRKNTDAATANSETTTEATFMKRTNTKNILGLSYKYNLNDVWNLSAFGKYYDVKVTGPIDISTGNSSVYEEQSRSFNSTGYGAATTYVVIPAVRLKVSYEKAYRLPTERELFGDEILETGDASLKPESSQNVNLNVTYEQSFHKIHSVYFDAGFVYRDTKDYIRRQIEQRYGGAYYTNHGKVRTVGFDIEARYFFQSNLSVGGNFTYLNIRNKERYSVTGQELVYYNDRMPNQPFKFANADAAYTFHNVLGKNNTLTIGYNMQWVSEFYRSWKSEGGNITIPTQFAHDISVNYALKNGMYNISLEARNITDEMLFDNYSLQKPGRSFHAKFRYFFFKAR